MTFNITAVSNFGEIDTFTTDDATAARLFFDDMFTLAINSTVDGTRGYVEVRMRVEGD